MSGTTIQAESVSIGQDRRWADIAGLVAVVALAVVVLTVIVVFAAKGTDEPGIPAAASQDLPRPTTEPAAPPVNPTTETAGPTTTEETTSAPTTTVDSEPELIYAEQMNLRSLDADADPPRLTDGARQRTFWVEYFAAYPRGISAANLYVGPGLGTGRAVAEWTGREVPDADTCLDHLRRFGVGEVSLSEGGSYCLESGEGRVVLISDLTVAPDGRYYRALITVWAPAGQR